MTKFWKLIFMIIGILILLWILCDVYIGSSRNQEINNNMIRVVGVIRNIRYLENTSEIEFEYTIDDEKIHSSTLYIEQLKKPHVGDSLILEVSSLHLDKIRISELNIKEQIIN